MSGVAFPVLRSVDAAWRDSATGDVTSRSLLDAANPDALRDTAHHLALMAVALGVLLEERDDDFSFADWIAQQDERLTLEAFEAQFTDQETTT